MYEQITLEQNYRFIEIDSNDFDKIKTPKTETKRIFRHHSKNVPIRGFDLKCVKKLLIGTHSYWYCVFSADDKFKNYKKEERL